MFNFHPFRFSSYRTVPLTSLSPIELCYRTMFPSSISTPAPHQAQMSIPAETIPRVSEQPGETPAMALRGGGCVVSLHFYSPDNAAAAQAAKRYKLARC
ncbi:hypothetical protein P7C70_g3573, partial [Phenoliferia sp. Uapishka_3]